MSAIIRVNRDVNKTDAYPMACSMGAPNDTSASALASMRAASISAALRSGAERAPRQQLRSHDVLHVANAKCK